MKQYVTNGLQRAGGYLRPRNLARELNALRLRAATRALTAIFGRKMQPVPEGNHVNLAGAVVFWYLQDGFKQFVMVRTPDNVTGDGRARFISCLGLGSHASMPAALRAVVETQLGSVYMRSLQDTALDADRVVAVPMFSYTDELTQVTTPVQTMLWVVQIQEAQADLIAAGANVEAVTVPEFAMSSQKVSSTHQALWQAVHRHIPKGRLSREPLMMDDTLVDDAIKDVNGGGGQTPRTLH